VTEALEKLSVVMALKSLERSQVALLVMDATEGLTAQDAHIAGYAHEAGRAIVVVVNKWDPRATRHGEKGRGRRAGARPAAVPRLRAPVLHLRHRGPGTARAVRDDRPDRRGKPRSGCRRTRSTAVLRQALDRRPVSVAGEPLNIQSANQVMRRSPDDRRAREPAGPASIFPTSAIWPSRCATRSASRARRCGCRSAAPDAPARARRRRGAEPHTPQRLRALAHDLRRPAARRRRRDPAREPAPSRPLFR